MSQYTKFLTVINIPSWPWVRAKRPKLVGPHASAEKPLPLFLMLLKLLLDWHVLQPGPRRACQSDCMRHGSCMPVAHINMKPVVVCPGPSKGTAAWMQEHKMHAPVAGVAHADVVGSAVEVIAVLQTCGGNQVAGVQPHMHAGIRCTHMRKCCPTAAC
jgi:hypothetical protein